MRGYGCIALMLLAAGPVEASVGDAARPRSDQRPVERLYPAIGMDEDGWRGLLPVILFDTDAVAERSTDSQRSEKPQTR